MSYVTKRAKKLGVPVVDADRPLVVAVTKGDVVNALKSDSKRCALVRSLERMSGVAHAYVFRTMAYLEFPDRMVLYVLPPSVQKEIVAFDRAQAFAPGVYQLSPPGNLRERRRNRDRSTDVRRARERRAELAKPSRRTRGTTEKKPVQMPAWSATLTSGDLLAAEFMDKMAAATNRALASNGKAAGVRRATKQPIGAQRMTLVNHAQYVRDTSDPDAG